VNAFTIELLKIAEICIPKSSTDPKKPYYPWFNKECFETIKERRKAYNIFKKFPTQSNFINYKQKYAKARRIIRQAKKESWKKYVSKLSHKTSAKQVWQMIRKISGKFKSSPTKFLETTAGVASSPKDIADTLGAAFAKNSSTANYTDKFKEFKAKAEKISVGFKSNNREHYNRPITVQELDTALRKAKNSSTGPDEVHYQILKHLPNTCKNTMVALFNHLWETDSFPSSWREATVIPIPKPGKDTTQPNNYRPIALTSCLCKTMERIINDRLVWYLEDNNILSEYQAGFRQGRNTTDQLVRLETSIREAFAKKEHLIGIFFDLEKAYDTTWKYGIQKDLYDSGLRGHLPTFISNFLQDRTFKVRFGSTLSDTFTQEMGAPQGSILSPTLFILKMNSITKCLSTNINCSLYVDDLLITCQSKNFQLAEQKIQECLRKLETWCNENGFKFSSTKTNCVHFTNMKNSGLEPNLILNGHKIPVEKETKFLGVIFDSKLSFIPHIEYVKKKCQKALNLLRVVSHREWGGDREVLLRLYRALVRSKLDYGAVVYSSARKSYLRRLDTIANQGLRLALVAFRTSPSVSLHAEAGELPLHLRRQKLCLQYALRISANFQNPTYSVLFRQTQTQIYQTKRSCIPPLSIRIKPLLDKLEFSVKDIDRHKQKIPPYEITAPEVRFDLAKYRKEETPPEVYKAKFGEIRETYGEYESIYTDGSREDDRVAAAAVTKDVIYTNRLSNYSSIYTAEARAIEMAIDHAIKSNKEHFIVYSDSKSVLQGILQTKPRNPRVTRIVEKLQYARFKGKKIVFCWIPSHIGIRGNEEADMAAKETLGYQTASSITVASDMRRRINEVLNNSWQSEWDLLVNNKLRQVLPVLKENNILRNLNRKDLTVYTRLRIGHSYITHCYLLKDDPPPYCVGCDEPITVKHILTNCAEFNHIRCKHYSLDTLESILDVGNCTSVISFLKEAQLYNKI
jgi:ribonuclease HI